MFKQNIMPENTNPQPVQPVQEVQPQPVETQPTATPPVQNQPGPAVIQPSAPAKGKNKTLLFVLLGCGGCVLLAIIGGVIAAAIGIGAITGVKKEVDDLFANVCTDVNSGKSINSYFSNDAQSTSTFSEDVVTLTDAMKGCKTVDTINNVSVDSTNGTDKLTLSGKLTNANFTSGQSFSANLVKESGKWKFYNLNVSTK